jgi:hypothetical protein
MAVFLHAYMEYSTLKTQDLLAQQETTVLTACLEGHALLVIQGPLLEADFGSPVAD